VKTAAEFKKISKHISKELPKAVKKRIEHKFEGVQAELLDDLGDIVRDELFHIFQGMPHGGRSSESPPDSPRTTSRSATPKTKAPLATEASAPRDALDLSPYINESLLGGFGNDSDFNFNHFAFGNPFECHFGDKESDSGYASNGTGHDLHALEFSEQTQAGV
jgi:hypothetical protein